MANLRKAAMGRECQVRIPGICNDNPETSVLAHYRLPGTCGIGMKPHDILGAICCSSCHDEIDRRTMITDNEYAKNCFADGVMRTQMIWIKEGLIIA